MIRDLNMTERRLLDYLLEPDFPGRDALRHQAATAKVEELDDCPCLRFHVEAPAATGIKHRIPIEADSQNIEILIHVVDGRLNELEIVQKNPEQPIHIPPLSEFKRFCPDNWQID
jgi:hypothetical protein